MFTSEVVVRCCYGHRLHGYNGRCARLHGHNGVVTVRVAADALDAQGFVADFYEVQRIARAAVDRFDHAMILGPDDPVLLVLKAMREHHVELASPPTAEHLARLTLDAMAAAISQAGHPWRVTSVRWEEEPGFCAEVTT